ncbi:MAG: 4'-phosphopantetheinyl transferase superfamily protein [Proteobacteria bacterium]|nr:4'-phosphopantetheinyl transferase superfamily protein [Pseudomonadota bacterium]MBU1715009.1 4'-phosphopantetheinyl transferase superfamily protein [Pseudomonadota bacterium]
MIEIYIACFKTRLSDDVMHKWMTTLPGSIRDAISRFQRWEDRQASLYGKLLLREALTLNGADPDCLEHLRLDRYGRPYLEERVDFNISHSGEFVVCAVTSFGKIGVDVERVRALDIVEFQKYISPENWQEINRQEDPLRSFFDHWTMRESVIKADGRGLSIPLDNLAVKNGAVALEGKEWFLRKLDLAPDYCCHLATDRNDLEIMLHKGVEIRFS